MAQPTPFRFSQAAWGLFLEEIIRPVMDHPGTDETSDVRLGYPIAEISEKVLNKGRTDFNSGHSHPKYGDLSADEKVLLYCFLSMKQHFFESLATFRAHKATIQQLFASELPTRFIDLGCGPGTAALALADCLGRPQIHYMGLDVALPMLNKAKSIIQAGIARGLLAANSSMRAVQSWNALHRSASSILNPVHVLFNATYLFASQSLDVGDISKAMMEYKRSDLVHRILFTYSNTAADIAGTKYRDFKELVKSEMVSSTGVAKQKISYYKKGRGEETGSATFVSELIRFK